ncbi:uncharacterized protein LOC131848084 [Achroia grisella]|uniref:uncharacterized protein LOC131848084 n=1 Tax=Achroia grisella TaxID=688607 RepID=UPI0027D2A3E5|nr:uncharacterized protein LOC131848084 [Achroia grisella]
MENLLVLQENNYSILQKTISNFKKTPKPRLNKSYLKVRLESLEKHWDIFDETHRNIVKTSTLEQRKKHEYFEKDLFSKCEEEYLFCKADITEMLESFESSNIVQEPYSESQKTWEEELQTIPVEELPTLEKFKKYLEGRFRVTEMIQTSYMKERTQIKPKSFATITNILMSGVLKRKQGEPIAQQTYLGWIISGGEAVERLPNKGQIISMHLSVTLDNMLQRFWECESLESENKNTLTSQEARAEEIYEKTVMRDEQGRYVVSLPFVRDNPILPENSREIAMRRLRGLERRLAGNENLKREYDNVLKEYITLNHMELVKDEREKDTVYLPHHAVFRDDKTTSKVRVVFDASCRGTNGVSLNDGLLIGPNLQEEFYMDDVLTGFDNVSDAINAQKELAEMLLKGKFELQKISSNSQEFMNSIDPEKRVNSIVLDINHKETVKTLGIMWETNEDSLKIAPTYMKSENTNLLTKRNILRQIASLFDPMGWLSPAIIKAKIFMQKLWLNQVDWDEELSNDLKEEWNKYKNDLPVLSEIKIPRWNGSTIDVEVELHGFADASQSAYAAVVYTRVLSNNKNPCQTTLIMARTKVAPVKQISLPRLELCAAALLSKLLKHVMRILSIDTSKTFAWSDSKVTLAWIKGDPNKWTPFVKNRVIEIRNNLNIQWLYINTKENPADPASRGLLPSVLKESHLWWQGPEFLQMSNFMLPKDIIPETELEKRVQIKCNTTVIKTKDDEFKLTLLNRFSSLKKLLNVVAFCRRWMKNVKRENIKHKSIDCEERDKALTVCVKIAQQIDFTDEIETLKKKKIIKRCSRLLPLCPYLDENDVLRVGGHLKHAELKYERKHPVILTRDNPLIPLLLNDAHKETLHGGP